MKLKLFSDYCKWCSETLVLYMNTGYGRGLDMVTGDAFALCGVNEDFGEDSGSEVPPTSTEKRKAQMAPGALIYLADASPRVCSSRTPQ